MKKLKEKLNAKLSKNGGFTLVEMLLVVAIIAVLIAISIPVVTSQLEKAREAADAANLRAAYAELMIDVLENEGTPAETYTVTLTQTQDGWQNTSIKNIGGVAIADITATAGKVVTLAYNSATDTVTFTTAT